MTYALLRQGLEFDVTAHKRHSDGTLSMLKLHSRQHGTDATLWFAMGSVMRADDPCGPLPASKAADGNTALGQQLEGALDAYRRCVLKRVAAERDEWDALARVRKLIP